MPANFGSSVESKREKWINWDLQRNKKEETKAVTMKGWRWRQETFLRRKTQNLMIS